MTTVIISPACYCYGMTAISMIYGLAVDPVPPMYVIFRVALSIGEYHNHLAGGRLSVAWAWLG